MFEMLDTLILLWILGWSTWCTLTHDGGCARRDCYLVHLCDYRLTLCNVYDKCEIVEIMGVAHIAQILLYCIILFYYVMLHLDWCATCKDFHGIYLMSCIVTL